MSTPLALSLGQPSDRAVLPAAAGSAEGATVREPLEEDRQASPRSAVPVLGHRPALDGLRGVAILGVVGLHAGLLPGGGAGVDVFFTLSGFLITCLLVEEYADSGRLSLKRFYARRFLRLAPAFFALVLVHLAYCVAFREGWDQKAGLAGGAVSLGYLSNWSRAYRWIPLFDLNHTWSLAIEEQFYLLWPLLLLAVLLAFKLRGRTAWVVFAAALCLAGYRLLLARSGTPLHRLYNGLDTRADALLIGCGTALLFKTCPVRAGSGGGWWLRVAAATSFLALLAFFACGCDETEPALYFGGYTALSAASALVILALCREPPGRGGYSRLFRYGWLTWVGKISYGLYLWHFFVFYVAGEKFPQAPAYVVVPAAIALSFAAAAVSFYALEKPVLRLKSRFEWRHTRREA